MECRPYKRQKTQECLALNFDTEVAKFEALPLPVLLLSLSNILLHPPTHRDYAKSLYLSTLSVLKVLEERNLDPDMECRAWTALAELGFRMGLGECGVESQVEIAITKAVSAESLKNHPTLRPYKVHLSILSSRISAFQQKPKLAQTTLKRLITSFLEPSDAPHLLYTAHLGHIASFTTNDASGSAVPTAQSLKAIETMHELASAKGHRGIVKLAAILRLQTLVQMGMWDAVQEALCEAEVLLALPQDSGKEKDSKVLAECAVTIAREERLVHESAFLVYVLVLGVLFYMHTGNASSVDARTKVLHEMLDGGVLERFGSGVVHIPFPHSQPLYIQITQPRVLMVLTFLITSVAKRDPVGRKPKRKLFAMEGLVVVEKELKKDPNLPLYASPLQVQAHFARLNALKADLIAELASVSIMRSEFGEAERHLAELIAHTRNSGTFNYFAARVTLLHAQLAHAIGDWQRAMNCYTVAAWLSRPNDERVKGEEEEDDGVEDAFLHAAARAGQVWLKLGLLRRDTFSQLQEGLLSEDELGAREEELKVREKEMKREGAEVVRMCEGMGSTLGAVASVLRSCLAEEFSVAKNQLRQALNSATLSTDNHLRALILALTASQYYDTAPEHAEAMLATAEQLAAGMGAQPRAPKGQLPLVQSQLHSQSPQPPSQQSTPQRQQAQAGSRANTPIRGARGAVDGVGNAPLRLWIGERSAELKRRAGDEEGARELDGVCVKLRGVVRRIGERGVGAGTPVRMAVN
ncbi:hypothetical protein DFP72DRAFT_819114 [Ephemerocybe angulata]|uniref:Uncharacterized protein n=1 Tax=Ephemerocybe angulata TaxID=980116 RepID=A0A8H6HMR3_9AGAR|nr:hypothetical protein DFP72DRAFT_819114 [Tulosesus angulatus]